LLLEDPQEVTNTMTNEINETAEDVLCTGKREEKEADMGLRQYTEVVRQAKGVEETEF